MARRPAERHPICPYCGYNLTGIFDRITTRFVRCPECGEELENHEVRWSHRPGDWTLAMGIRSGSIFLLQRGALVAAIIIANILFLDWLAGAVRFRVPLLVTQFIAGIIVGKLLSKGFEDAAGFFGVLLPVMATTALALIAISIIALLPLAYAAGNVSSGLIVFFTCSFATIVVIHDYLREMM